MAPGIVGTDGTCTFGDQTLEVVQYTSEVTASNDSTGFVSRAMGPIEFRLRSSTPTSSSSTSWDFENQYSTTSSLDYSIYNSGWWERSSVLRSPKERLRELLRERSAPAILVRDTPGHSDDPREQRARQTLRMVVGEDKYRRFLRTGWVSATNTFSQRVYHLSTGHKFIHVYDNGKLIQRLCVVLRGGFAPTDALIMRYLLAVNDEERLWKLANKQGVGDGRFFDYGYRVQRNVPDHRPLLEVQRELRVGA